MILASMMRNNSVVVICVPSQTEFFLLDVFLISSEFWFLRFSKELPLASTVGTEAEKIELTYKSSPTF